MLNKQLNFFMYNRNQKINIDGYFLILNKKIKIFLAIASFMMALAICLGAFGAHGLKSILDEYM